MRLEVVAEAETELHEAIAYYEAIQAGLGLRLKTEARRAISWIRENPLLLRVTSAGYRRVNLRVFPYYIPYFIRNDTVWVLAVAHGRRRPEYWLGRKSKIG